MDDFIENLGARMHLDLDATHVNDQALKKVGEQLIRDTFEKRA